LFLQRSLHADDELFDLAAMEAAPFDDWCG
jgi:hypothetical protein